MVLGIIWAGLIGAGFGMERGMRGLRPGMGACTLSAICGYLFGQNFLSDQLHPATLAYAVSLAAAGVAIAIYLTTAIIAEDSDNASRQLLCGRLALITACAFGLLIGLDAPRLAGIMILITIFSRTIRPRPAQMQSIPLPVTHNITVFASYAQSAPVVLIPGLDRRRPEESRNNDEGSQ